MNYIEKNYTPNWINVVAPSRMDLEKSNSGSEARQSTWNADGGTVPIIYGRQRVGGKVFAIAGTTALLTLGIVLCEGIVEEIEEITINDTEAIITFSAGQLPTIVDSIGDPVSGISWEVYKGNENIISPLLAAAIPTYSDTLLGICYAVVAISSSTSPTGTGTNSFPRIAATIKGKKIYDPRDQTQLITDSATWTWSKNPSLCLADLITSRTYGLGKTVDWDSVVVCADNNDKLVEAIPLPVVSNPWPPLPSGTFTFLLGTTQVYGAVFDKWTRREFVDYYLNLPNVHAKKAMLSNAYLRDFMYKSAFPLDISDDGLSRKDAFWRIDCDVWNTRLQWCASNELALMSINPTAYADGEAYAAAGGGTPYSDYYYGGGTAGYATFHSFDLYYMQYRYVDNIGTKSGYALAGRPTFPNDLPLNLEKNNQLDIVIDVEQETLAWIEILRGYANCFLSADGGVYTLLVDKPIGFAFSAVGADWSYVNIPPYSGIDITGELCLQISFKPDHNSFGSQTLVSKGYYGESDFELIYVKPSSLTATEISSFLFTWHNTDGKIITYTMLVNNLYSEIFYTLIITLNSAGDIEAYLAPENDLVIEQKHQIVDISRNYPGSITFGINVAVPAARPITLGKAYNGPAGSFFVGLIDEFRLWNTYKSLKEISSVTNNILLHGIDNTLVCHLTFNEGCSSWTKATSEQGIIQTDQTYNYGWNVPESALYPTLHTPDPDLFVWAQHDGPYDFYKFDGNSIIDNTLKFHRRGIMNLPTVIELGYTLNLDYNVINGDGSYGQLRPWKEDYISLDKSALHNNKVRVSRVPMIGITRYSEGYRVAQFRYNTIISDSNIMFSAIDDALNVNVGDGIQVHCSSFEVPPNTLFKPFRVTSIQQRDIGTWNISAIEYDPKNYIMDDPIDPTFKDTNT